MFARARQAPTTPELHQARADVDAVHAVVEALARSRTADDAVQTALDVVREQFGWAYASCWRLDEAAGVLRVAAESGEAGEAFRAVTRTATFAEGVGLSGRAWRTRDLVLVADLAELRDCVRAPVAQRSGIRSAVCFPVVEDGAVVATMDFFSAERLEPSPRRLQTLRSVGVLVSQAVTRVHAAERQVKAAQDIAAVTQVLRELSRAATVQDVVGRALEAIRTGFDWTYGSYWRVDPSDAALHWVQESGDAGAEFRAVTKTASFREGVGLSGRAWRSRDLVFVEDLAEVTDCVRVPAAQRAGVKSGVCLPILVHGEVVGTMDFFATRTLVMSAGRADALRNTAFLVGSAMERLAAAERLATAGQELISSITEVERNVLAATSVAGEGERLAAAADDAVARLGTSSDEIGAVVKTIRSIASQTNLLALNATIEAARAGDAGRGFAVVAGEVKELANETATATGEVDVRVRDIQAQVRQVVGALAKIGDVVREINETQAVIGGVLTEQVAVTRDVLA
ncbi:GAF domain-containing protein [Angustibacter aerolatus]